MKIIKIFVENMPKSCKDCDLYDSENYMCLATFEDVDLWKVDEKRHEKCPLVEIWYTDYVSRSGIIKP